MIALVTGASSGIGYEIVKELCLKNIECIAVARNKEKLEELKRQFENIVQIYSLDLSQEKNCYLLYEKLKNKNIDIVINNAGVGVLGNFIDTNLRNELDMIDINIKAVHILTKLFLKDMVEKDYGYILNISSIGAYINGPIISSYYATKAYVSSFSKAIIYELSKLKSKVYVGVAYPGPVNSNFNYFAGAKNLKGAYSPEFVAKYIVRKMLKKNHIIVPGVKIKLLKFITKILPGGIISNISYYQNLKKIRD